METLHPAEAAYFSAIRPGDTWASHADTAVAELSATGRMFTADDIAKAVGEEPHHPNAWGGLFRYWAGRDLITCTGYTKSRRAGRNGSTVAIWKGTRR